MGRDPPGGIGIERIPGYIIRRVRMIDPEAHKVTAQRLPAGLGLDDPTLFVIDPIPGWIIEGPGGRGCTHGKGAEAEKERNSHHDDGLTRQRRGSLPIARNCREFGAGWLFPDLGIAVL